jgi:acetylornithine deacetylase/succinyl-diaminopimelate desuccinylase-like protein
MKNTANYINENKEKFVNDLFDLLRIPSVSADPAFQGDVQKCAKTVQDHLIAAGADNVEIIPTKGHPIVYGEKIISSELPTVLVYGHYDVQPADPIELWDTPPFEPTVKDGKVYARGASDDKGQMFMHVKAFESMMKADELPCNVKFMIEGEEEVGSKHLGEFLIENTDKLKADVILVSDTGMIGLENPSITTGLRGMSYMEVELTGPNRDLHSGLYGGAVQNPINALCNMIATLTDEHNKITIPGFYDDVEEVSQAEREQMAKAPFSLEQYKKHLDIDAVSGETGFTTLERASIRPTMDVNGIWGGYIGEGAKTVIPSKAFAKISMRLVPGQDFHKIGQLFKDHFESIAPEGTSVKATFHHGGKPAVTPIDSAGYKAASMAMEQTFGKTPVPLRSGGSIPIVALFEEVLGLKTILMGFGLDTDAIHSPNEHYGLENYYKGIETIPYFYKYFTELNK